MKKLLSAVLVLGTMTLTAPVMAQEAPELGNPFIPQFAANIDEDDDIAALPAVPSFGSEAIGVAAGAAGKGLNLSDEQLEKIAALKNKAADAAGPKMLEAKSLQRQLRELTTKENIDRAKVFELQNKINAIRADLSTSRLTLKLDTLNILTPEQREQVRHKQLKRLAMGGQMGGPRGHKRGGRQGGHGQGGAMKRFRGANNPAQGPNAEIRGASIEAPDSEA